VSTPRKSAPNADVEKEARPMTARIAVPAAVLATLALASSAQGRADVDTFHSQEPISFTLNDHPCFPGVLGTVTGTDTVDGRFTENGPPALGFHAHGVDVADYRIDFSDGRYIVGEGITHFDFNATARQHVTETDVWRDRTTAFAADGTPLGPVTIHATSHVSYIDANGNGEPDPGEFTAFVDRFRITCP
jgi:hypothetical protein